MANQDKVIDKNPLKNGSAECQVWLINETTKYNHDTRVIENLSGERFYIRKKTGDILLYLINNRGSVVSVSTFLDEIWEHDCVSKNVIAQSVRELRKALSDESKEIIATVPKLGYKLNASVRIDNDDKGFSESKVSRVIYCAGVKFINIFGRRFCGVVR